MARRGRAHRRADRRGRHEGRRTRDGRRHVRLDLRYRRIDPRVRLDPASRASGRPRAALRSDRRSRHHDSAGARRARSAKPTCVSDTRCVWPFVGALIDACGAIVRWMRDPTRGGVATALNELAAMPASASRSRRTRYRARRRRGACEIAGTRSAAHRQRRAVSRRRFARTCGRRARGDSRGARRREARSASAKFASQPKGQVVGRDAVRWHAQRSICSSAIRCRASADEPRTLRHDFVSVSRRTARRPRRRRYRALRGVSTSKHDPAARARLLA